MWNVSRMKRNGMLYSMDGVRKEYVKFVLIFESFGTENKVVRTVLQCSNPL